jgi:uncharacterized protein
MSEILLFSGYNSVTILLLTAFSFLAGFTDAVVGGGGLIQIPALLINLPDTPLPALFGTNKIAALSGTSVAAYQYARRVKYNIRLLIVISLFSFCASNIGARSLSYFNPEVLRPVILVILVVIAIYTFLRKDLGTKGAKELSFRKQLIYGSLIGTLVGFYDGFFGPGTGSFFVLGFVVVLGFEFITASAYAKVINCVTNLSALIVFMRQGNYLPVIAVLMAAGNVIGSIAGSRMALKKGNRFIRIVFLIIVLLMIVRYSYDIFMK